MSSKVRGRKMAVRKSQIPPVARRAAGVGKAKLLQIEPEKIEKILQLTRSGAYTPYLDVNTTASGYKIHIPYFIHQETEKSMQFLFILPSGVPLNEEVDDKKKKRFFTIDLRTLEEYAAQLSEFMEIYVSILEEQMSVQLQGQSLVRQWVVNNKIKATVYDDETADAILESLRNDPNYQLRLKASMVWAYEDDEWSAGVTFQLLKERVSRTIQPKKRRLEEGGECAVPLVDEEKLVDMEEEN